MTTPVLLDSTRLSAFGIAGPRADGLCLPPETPDGSALSIRGRWLIASDRASGATDHADLGRWLPGFTASRRVRAGQIPIAHRSV
jgi:hypothetical protein